MNKLSHSSVSKFQECGMAWKFHYKDRLRPKLFSSALLFGTALDKALEASLKGEDPYETFAEYWERQKINNKEESLVDNINIVYSDSDVDLELLTDFQKKDLENDLPNWQEIHSEVLKKKEKVGFNRLIDEEKKLVNTVAWYTLGIKGVLMIQAFEKDIKPKIKKVLGLQKKILLKNDLGDEIIGYVDLVCEYEDQGIVVIDFKTSTRLYEEDSVLVSPQLSLYVHSLFEEYQTRKAGYIVLNKRVNKNKFKCCAVCGKDLSGSRYKKCPEDNNGKRCDGEILEKINPSIFIQTIISDIPEQTEAIVMDNIDDINESIKTERFTRNFASCIKPWGKCAFYSLCYHNDKSDLIELDPKE